MNARFGQYVVLDARSLLRVPAAVSRAASDSHVCILEDADHRYRRLFRARRERPRDSTAAEQRGELAPVHVLRQPCRWKAMQQRVCVLHTHAISAAVGFNDSQFLSVRAPADDSASMTDGGSGHAAASDHCPTRAASEANLCDHAI